jgi:hypothetical protein
MDVQGKGGQLKVVFDPQQFSLVYLGGRRMLVNALLSGAPEDVDDLIANIADALVGESAYIDVRYTETVEPGDTLLPATGRALSRRYQTVDDVSGGREIQALMIRNDAIQNALRWIDDWHGDPNFLCVTPVEPSMRHRPGGLRRDGVMAPDIAQIRRNPAPMLAELAQGAPGPIAHYLAANIVRGGQL